MGQILANRDLSIPYKALVTGGTRGIGAAIAQRLVECGAEVFVTGRTKPEEIIKGCNFLQVDFSERKQIEKFSEEVSALNFQVLINNAGVNKIGPFADYSVEDFDRLYEINLRAPFLLSRSVLPFMRAQGWGRIVNISSIFGKISKEYRAAYSATKFALDGMTAGLSAEVSSQGILANCVAPGFIDTDLTRQVLGQAGIDELVARVPAKRLGTSQEIAELVCWLASPLNSFVTGQNIAIDGGFTRV